MTKLYGLLAGAAYWTALFIMPVGNAHAQERPPQPNTMDCNLVDKDNNLIRYLFGAGTDSHLTELGYSYKGVAPEYKDGPRPTWKVTEMRNQMGVITPDATPDYALVSSLGNGTVFAVTLMHKGTPRADGYCIFTPAEGKDR